MKKSLIYSALTCWMVTLKKSNIIRPSKSYQLLTSSNFNKLISFEKRAHLCTISTMTDLLETTADDKLNGRTSIDCDSVQKQESNSSGINSNDNKTDAICGKTQVNPGNGKQSVLVNSSKTELTTQNEAVDDTSNLSRRARKRLRRRQLLQQHYQKKKRSMGEDSDVIKRESLRETEYYLHNGLRKVYPYHYTFTTFTKRRWIGRTLLDIFVDEFRHDTAENYENTINEGHVKVNGKPSCVSYILKDGDYIENSIHRHELAVTPDPIQIIHEDDDVLVVNKPSSIPIHPCGRYRHNTMTFILDKQYGYHNLRGVYRLDRLTSGVLVFCKTQSKANEIQRHVRGRLVEKEYVCKVEGEFPSGPVECDKPLDILSHKLGIFKVCSSGKEAKTRFQRMSYDGEYSIIKCFPHTGRTHQIRVHLQYMGFPILNDPIYNTDIWGPEKGKDGNFFKSDDQLINDLMLHHTAEQHIDKCLPAASERNVEASDPVDRTDVSTAAAGQEESVTGVDLRITLDSVAMETEDGDAPNKEGSNCESKLTVDDPSVDSTHGANKEMTNAADMATVTKCPLNGSPSKIDDNIKPTCQPKRSAVDNASNQDDTPVSDDTHSPILKRAKIDTEQGNLQTENTNTDLTDSPVKGKQQAALNEVRSQQPVALDEFVPEKYIVDENCPQCCLVYKDPTPDELQLYLHAISYKGPNWHYTTDLPEWAKGQVDS